MLLKTAIIGMGNIGKLHAEVCSKFNELEIVGIVDTNKEIGIKAAEIYKTKFYTDLDDLIRNDKIDIAVVCTPTYLHPQIVKRLAYKKINIYCEKPIALTLKEADSMIQAVRKNKVKAIVGHVLRFWPEYCKAKEIVDNNILGKPISAYCKRVCHIRGEAHKNWKIDENLSDGAALDVQIHDIDYLIWLFGNPVIIKSIGSYNKNLGGWFHVDTILKFKNNITGLVTAEWNPIKNFPFLMELRILFEAGALEWKYASNRGYEGREEKFDFKVNYSDGTADIYKVENIDPYYNEWKYFIDCIIKNKPIINSSMESARNSLSITLQTIKSCKTHK
ncbi:MAG: Gfo/Idh/MocA family oxidoreductase [Actinobacteria bacterium]|nr:Gfo/Idh/MocA family oxidoreductase [Actinomycetota bacterium]